MTAMSLITVVLIAVTLERWVVAHPPGAHTICLSYHQAVLDIVRTCARHHERLTDQTFRVAVPRGAIVWAEVMYDDRTAVSNAVIAKQ